MLKVKYKTLKSAKLPLSVCRGTEAQRFAMSRKMSEKLLAQLPDKFYSDEHLIASVNELLEPNKINFVLEDLSGNKFHGATRLDVDIAYAENETINIGIQGYKILLTRLKNGLYDKFTAVHEFGHLFDHICNPKITNFSTAKLLFNENVETKVSTMKDLVMKKTEKMQELKNLTQTLLNEIPDEYAIDALQFLRGSLKSEIHQYSFGLKTLVNAGEYQEFLKEFIIVRKLKFKKKLKLVNKLLKERIAISRENIAKKKR